MGDKPFERPRRTGVNYTRILNINPLLNKNKFKFNPINKKEKFLNKKLDAENTAVNVKQTVETLKSKPIPKVTILLKDDNNDSNQDQTTEEMTKVEENGENEELNENQENNNTTGAKKYKLWIIADKILGKNLNEKLENVSLTLKKQSVVIKIQTESFNNRKMIAAYYDNEEEMKKGKICDVGEYANKPTYMHRAEIFKRNPDKEMQHGVKLWDVPLGFRNKDIKQELELKFGEITRISLRVNNMWQSAVIIFKEKSSAQKLLANWSIIIGEDSLRVTHLDQTIDNLKSRGQYAARVIGLPNGITARELWPHIEKLGAKTCYFPRTRNYRKKGEAIISFQEEEARENACNAVWEGGDLNIRIVNIQTKTCHRCHETDHFVANCPHRIQDHEYKNKAAERIEKFANLDTTSDQRLERIEQVLNKLCECLEILEHHVMNTTEEQIQDWTSEQEEDEEMIDEEVTENNNDANNNDKSKLNKKHETNNKLDIIILTMQQMTNRIETIETRVGSTSTFSGTKTSESNIDYIKRELLYNYIKNSKIDIMGIAETNCKENNEKWFIDEGKKYRIHWSSDGIGRAIRVDMALPKKTTVRIIQIYLSSKKCENKEVMEKIKNWVIQAQQKNYKLIVMGDFNAVPRELIDCYRTMHPESSGFTWQRDNSTAESHIDAIWMSEKWGGKMESCYVDNLNLITESDHKLVDLKIRRNWQIRERKNNIINNSPRYNTKVMCEEKWLKFTKYVEEKINNSIIEERERKYGVSINSMEKTWKTLKNIMIEGADHAIPKKREKKHNKKINRNVAENMKKAKSLNKIYRFVKKEKAKSLLYIKNHVIFKRETHKLSILNFKIKKIIEKNDTREDLIEALRIASLDFQSVARAEKKKETLKQIQEAVERRWENLKENPKRMINSILDRQRKSIIMDRIINENEEGNIEIITDSIEIKEAVKNYFCS
ncbi:13299_t:CDS:2 [Dentiscutata erythropus]|uniref:13299_t:CDS:1 n=1 Tax=Dentiscutata erythropus TaxID=1348616 RepID=A0A9N9HX80_9GLOM|nr:13299_t:CDS:2 [Dentiscutata erythropus]